MEILKKDILKEMEEKSRANLNRGIDIAISILKRDYPFITGWDYKDKPETYRSSIYLVLKADMNLASEFYNSPIRKVYKHAEANVAYPFSPLEISLELNEDEKYELFKVIQKSLVEIYDEIPSELRHEFESYASEIKIPKELYIDGFILEKPKENINESVRGVEFLNESEEETTNYIPIIEEIIEPFKNEDCVCEINVLYDEEDDMYSVYLVFSAEELNDKFFNFDGNVTYRNKLVREIKAEIKTYLPIDNLYVGSYGKPNCGWKPLNESVMGPEFLDLIKTIVDIYKDDNTICDIEVSYDDEDEMYDIMIIFDSEELLKIRDRGGYARQIRNKIGEDIVKYIPDFLNFYVGSYVRHCKESINENRYKVPSSDYNSLEKIINMEMKEKYWWWKDIKINTLNYIELYGDVQIEAELTVDEEWGANQWGEFYYNTKFPGNEGWEDDDGYSRRVSLADIMGSTYAEVIRNDLREIFKYTLNIDMYIMSFINVYLIFE